MSTEHIEYRVEGSARSFAEQENAVTAAEGRQVYRLTFGRRGVRHADRLVSGRLWMRVQWPPPEPAAARRRR